MSIVERLIMRLFPNKIITYRISDLIDQSSNENMKNTDICISIETDTYSRRFCYFTIDELIILYQNCPALERSLYELISPMSKIKAYIDFEYYINNNPDIENSQIGISCSLKMLHLFLNSQQNIEEKKYNDLILKQFLILQASTSEKIFYHLIHANRSILFENNITLGIFIKVIVHFFLWLTALHQCTSFNINVTLQKCSISDLVTLLTPHITLLRTSCAQCYIYLKYITASEIAYLLVLNKQNQYTLAIDLGVYSRNQQFRLFDCVKKNKRNSLVQIIAFPFDRDSKYTYYEILKKSLITYHDVIDVPILCLKDSQFLYESSETISKTLLQNNNFINLNNINTHFNICFTHGLSFMSKSNSTKHNISLEIITHINTNEFEQEMQQFTFFVEKLIKSDRMHQGFIRSCVRGNRNTDVIFFNIGGEYRYCQRKETHHQRNTTAILVDIKNRTFSIRCKDPACNNSILVWNKIE